MFLEIFKYGELIRECVGVMVEEEEQQLRIVEKIVISNGRSYSFSLDFSHKLLPRIMYRIIFCYKYLYERLPL